MVEINNKTRSKINLLLVKRLAEKFLASNKKRDHNVSIAFVGDAVMRALNKTYRGEDGLTDVLAFAGDGNFLGEIVINYAQIKRQSKARKSGVQRELAFILVHGLLHLLGYNDDTEEGGEEMERLGDKFIRLYYNS